jgi:hypothetical protein
VLFHWGFGVLMIGPRCSDKRYRTAAFLLSGVLGALYGSFHMDGNIHPSSPLLVFGCGACFPQ